MTFKKNKPSHFMCALISNFVLILFGLIGFYFEVHANVSSQTISGIPSRVLELSNAFDLTMNQCPDKIWNKYSWKDAYVVFVDQKSNKSYLWDGSKNEVSEYDIHQLPSPAVHALYHFFHINGKSAMSIQLTGHSFSSFLFAIATHELFHFIGQNGWEDGLSGGRGTAYPIPWRARYFRQKLFERLQQELISDTGNSLQKAKYWYEKWKREFPGDFYSSTDRYEGTADYISTMAQAILETGCEVDPILLESKALKLFNEDNEDSSMFSSQLDEFVLKPDLEGYVIGQLATLILRFRFNKIDWQDSIKGGKSPLEILFQDVISETDSDNIHLKNKIKKIATEKNKEIGHYLDRDLQFLKDPNYIRVRILPSWAQSNFEPRFFVSLSSDFKDINSQSIKTIIPLAVDLHFISPDKKSHLTLNQDTVLFINSMSPCEEKGIIYTLIHKDFIFLHDESKAEEYKHIELHQKNVKGKVWGRFLDNKKGFKFLCSGEGESKI